MESPTFFALKEREKQSEKLHIECHWIMGFVAYADGKATLDGVDEPTKTCTDDTIDH
jgi:hypothetical protein